MADNFEFNPDAAKVLIEDNTNVSEPNHLKDLVQILLNLFLFLVMIYFSVFITSGLILKGLSMEQQIALENFISNTMKVKTVPMTKADKAKFEDVKNRILLADESFPKTSNLDIKILQDDELNALCYPNGNIYITRGLYNRIKTDEQLTFVIAHEMAHYKNKDHLMNLRQSISGGVAIIVLSVARGSADADVVKLVDNVLEITDLKYSRRSEEKADYYAGKILLQTFGSVKGGIELLEILGRNNELYELELLSTHPLINKRIKNLQSLK